MPPLGKLAMAAIVRSMSAASFSDATRHKLDPERRQHGLGRA
jgi:hypothetical protein